MAYDVSNYATLGLLSALLDINNPDAPDDHDLSLVSNSCATPSLMRAPMPH